MADDDPGDAESPRRSQPDEETAAALANELAHRALQEAEVALSQRGASTVAGRQELLEGLLRRAREMVRAAEAVAGRAPAVDERPPTRKKVGQPRPRAGRGRRKRAVITSDTRVRRRVPGKA
jgi:hypothetical protein